MFLYMNEFWTDESFETFNEGAQWGVIPIPEEIETRMHVIPPDIYSNGPDWNWRFDGGKYIRWR